jgi:hypothetical protein
LRYDIIEIGRVHFVQSDDVRSSRDQT